MRNDILIIDGYVYDRKSFEPEDTYEKFEEIGVKRKVTDRSPETQKQLEQIR